MEREKGYGLWSKVVNSVPFRSEWPKHSLPIQKIEQISSHFKSRSVPDISAKFRIFLLNSTQNVPVSFHIFRSVLEKPLNQIEPYSI